MPVVPSRRFLRYSCFLIVIPIFTFCRLGGWARATVEPQAPLADFASYLDQRMPVLMAKYDISGSSIALIQENELRWYRSYGYADRARAQPVRPETVFEVGSISKPVTAWGVMRLAEVGKIDLDAPFDRYLTRWHLPRSEFNTAAVTARRLLSHSSGMAAGILPRFSPGGQAPTIEALLAGYGQEGAGVQLIDKPGSTFLYSNYGYLVLQLLIEEVTGRAFADYMESEILKPLGMESSVFSRHAVHSSRLATGYLYNGEPASDSCYIAQACGGLYTTAIDLARLAAVEMAGYNGRSPEHVVLNPAVETSGLMWSFSTDAYGLGHALEFPSDGPLIVSHGGQNAGWISYYAFAPETGDGIVMLTNSERSFALIAQILADWAHWRGLGALKMSRALLTAAAAVRIFVVCLFLLSSVFAGQLIGGLAARKRRFSLKAQGSRLLHIVRKIPSIILLVVWWGFARSSLRELIAGLSVWLSASLLTCALVLLSITVFPRTAPMNRSVNPR